MQDPEETFTLLGELVLSDPRQARATFIRILESDFDTADGLLKNLVRPDGSRLRSLIANIARNYPEKQRLVPYLLQWQDIETDEFTARAIALALADVGERQHSKAAINDRALPAQTVELYRYVSDRLKHRLRNALFGAQGYIADLTRFLESTELVEIRATVARLGDAMLMIDRTLESVDADPSFFRQRRVTIVDWLKNLNARYASQYPAIKLKTDAPEGSSPAVFASDFLLETIFWNLWTNAHQMIGPTCEITAMIRRRNGIEISIFDNGAGFPESFIGVAFSQQYSSSGSLQRGRGLLEVAEAVDRLGGTVNLFQYQPSDYRIKILLPEYPETT